MAEIRHLLRSKYLLRMCCEARKNVLWSGCETPPPYGGYSRRSPLGAAAALIGVTGYRWSVARRGIGC